MTDQFSVAQAAKAIGAPLSSVRFWLSYSGAQIGKRTATGRVRLSLRDLRILALISELTTNGFAPAVAAEKAEHLVRTAGDHGLLAVVARAPAQKPELVPHGAAAFLADNSYVLVDLASLWRRVNEGVARLGR